MKKYAINYNRSFPDHRVPIDYHFNRTLMQGPSSYFKLSKDAFNATHAKYFHISLSLISLIAVGIAGTVKFWNHNSEQTEIGKKDMPTYKYVLFTNRGGYGAYDNTLNKFEKQPGGIRDLPWTE